MAENHISDAPVIHITANHLFALIILAGATCERRGEDMHIVEAGWNLLNEQAMPWLASYQARMDQINAEAGWHSCLCTFDGPAACPIHGDSYKKSAT